MYLIKKNMKQKVPGQTSMTQYTEEKTITRCIQSKSLKDFKSFL